MGVGVGVGELFWKILEIVEVLEIGRSSIVFGSGRGNDMFNVGR